MTSPNRIKVLQIAPSLGVHGGIEAVAVAIADESSMHEDILPSILFRLRGGCSVAPGFKKLTENRKYPVHLFRLNVLTLLHQILIHDVIHCHYPLTWALIPAFLFGKKTVVTVHNKMPPGGGCFRYLERSCLINCSKVIFNSNFVSSTWGILLDQKKFRRVPATASRNVAFVPSNERRGFIVIARLIPEKGVKQLIQAYQDSSIDHARHPLFVVGVGPFEAELRQEAAKSKTKYIHFLGYRSEDEKVSCIARSLWNIAPAIFEEDQGMTPIEATLCGVPSIITNIGGLPESGGPGALAVPPCNVKALTDALKEAAEMSAENYAARCEANQSYLTKYLEAEDHYSRLYKDL